MIFIIKTTCALVKPYEKYGKTVSILIEYLMILNLLICRTLYIFDIFNTLEIPY